MMHELQSAFNFTEADLQANRANRRTPAQQHQIEKDASGFWRAAGYTVLVAFIGTIFGSVSILLEANPIYHDILWRVVIGIVVLGTLAVIAAIYHHKRQARADAHSKDVMRVHGDLQIVEPLTGTIGNFRVNGQEFLLDTQEQYDLLCQLAPATITVYCTPYRHKILSVE